MVKNIIFDLGGVILDLDSREAMRRFEALGLMEPEKYLGPYGQKGMFLDFETGRLSLDELTEEFSRSVGRVVSPQEMQHAWMGFIARTDEAKLRNIDSLSRDYGIYLLSNTNPAIMMWAESPEFSETGRPLSSWFRKMYLSFRMGMAKPGREIFETLIADAGIDPAETIFVDDGSSNVATARELGFHTLQPLNGTDWMPQLSELLHSL